MGHGCRFDAAPGGGGAALTVSRSCRIKLSNRSGITSRFPGLFRGLRRTNRLRPRPPAGDCVGYGEKTEVICVRFLIESEDPAESEPWGIAVPWKAERFDDHEHIACTDIAGPRPRDFG
jgi:hypothetical protein